MGGFSTARTVNGTQDGGLLGFPSIHIIHPILFIMMTVKWEMEKSISNVLAAKHMQL